MKRHELRGDEMDLVERMRVLCDDCMADPRNRNASELEPCCGACIERCQAAKAIESLRQDVEDYESIFRRKGEEIAELQSQVRQWKYAAESHQQESWRLADEVGRLKAERDDLQRQLDAANRTLGIYAKTLATKQETIERMERNAKLKV